MKITFIFLFIFVHCVGFSQLASWNNGSFKETDELSANNLKLWNEGNQYYYEEVSRNQNAIGVVEVILNDLNGRSMQVRLTNTSSYWKFPNDTSWTVLYNGSWSVKPTFNATPVVNNPAPVSNPIVNSTNSSVNHKPAANIKSVQIGTQTWMVENLNVSTFRNGDPIPEAKTVEEWLKTRESEQPAWCYYDNDPKNGAKYGKLYNWYAVNDPRGLAPAGWHVPADEEWTKLLDFLGGTDLNAGTGNKLKSQETIGVEIYYLEVGGYYETKWVPCSNCSYWTETQKVNNPCTSCKNRGGENIKTGNYIPKENKKFEENIKNGWENGTNESGFSALAGGYRNGVFGTFYDIRTFGGSSEKCYFWSTTTNNSNMDWFGNYSDTVWIRTLSKDGNPLDRDLESKYQGFSVRCVKD